jgi:hypothetical protein
MDAQKKDQTEQELQHVKTLFQKACQENTILTRLCPWGLTLKIPGFPV